MCFAPDAVPPMSSNGDSSTRGEDIVLTSSDGTRFAAYAAHPGKATGAGIVILPDVRGLFQFYKELAMRFAEVGVEAVSIDYFGRTAGLAPRDDAFDYFTHVSQVFPEPLNADIAAGIAYLNSLPDKPRSLFTVGFCFGGFNSFLQATNDALAGVIGFYGSPSGPTRNGAPTPLSLVESFRCPVLGLFGGADTYITAEKVEAFDAALTNAGIEHSLITYPGAPHSFFDRSHVEFAKESADSWERMQAFIAAHTA